MADLLTQFERTAALPAQWLANMVVLIPKIVDIERPIALMSTVYRYWCKLRQSELHAWQEQLTLLMPWERAKPGNQCLHIALRRLLRSEVFTAQKKFAVSVLCDLSFFYDRISLVKLSERWSTVQYPPTHEALATLMYQGSRYLEGEAVITGPMYATHGILAGDPQAPQVAKVYLHGNEGLP